MNSVLLVLSIYLNSVPLLLSIILNSVPLVYEKSEFISHLPLKCTHGALFFLFLCIEMEADLMIFLFTVR